MYTIKLDEANKILNIKLSGTMQSDEVIAYMNEVITIFQQYKPKELSMLVLANRLDPLSQENAKTFKKMTEACIIYGNKIAVVYGNRFMTQVQMKRLESEVRQNCSSDTIIMRFANEEEALKYLKN